MLCPNCRKSFQFSSSSINIITFVLQTFTHPLLVLQCLAARPPLCEMHRCSRHTFFFFFLNRTTYLQTSVLGNELTVVPGYRLVLTFLIKADLAGLQPLQTVN